jgi:hypothetical protein
LQVVEADAAVVVDIGDVKPHARAGERVDLGGHAQVASGVAIVWV